METVVTPPARGRSAQADEAVFDALFLGHAMRLARLAHLLGARDAEDVVQEAFVKLYAAWSRVAGEDAVPYLNRIVVNEVRSRARRQQTADRKRHLVTVVTDEPGPDGSRRAVVDELARLPRRQREALVLRYWLDLPHEQVAEIMGVRPGTVKSQVSRGLAALATALGEEES